VVRPKLSPAVGAAHLVVWGLMLLLLLGLQ
jgi:hypothetical protein